MLANSALEKIIEGQSPSDFATSSCLFPRKRLVRLSETGDYQELYTPCNRCVNCASNRRNELASRMFLHSLSYEFCYFVTLTYGSYNLFPFERHPFQNDWLSTIPVRDSNNSLHHDAWSPSILIQKHLTKFLKRLRANTGFDISYAACGEYGEDFKRPHFHVILWSHQRISVDMVRNAWSLECKRTKNKLYVRPWRCDLPKTPENGFFRFYLGRVDFHDLWANGSLNYDGKHCGVYDRSTTDKNAIHNFTYVAKYIGKNDPISWCCNMPQFFLKRIQFAFNVYSGNVNKLDELITDLSTLNYYNHVKINVNYEENYSIPQIDYMDFKKIISPFFVSSRRPSLGKLWYLENRKAILEERAGMPKFMAKKIPYPSYFFRLASLDKYPLRLRKDCPSGVSPTKDLLPRVYEYFSKLREDRNHYFAVRGTSSIYNLPRKDRSYAYAITDVPQRVYHDFIKDHCNTLDSIDLISPLVGTIHYVYDGHFEIFEGLIYDKQTREYKLYDFYEREDFCDYVLSLIEKEYSRYPDKLDKLKTKALLYDTILEDPKSKDKVDYFLTLHNDMQRYYKLTHKTDNQ